MTDDSGVPSRPPADEEPRAAGEAVADGAGGRPPAEPGRGSRPAQRPLAPTIILLLVVGGLLLAIGLWTGGNDRATPARAAQPATLTIVEPKDSAVVDAPLEITFATTAPLRLSPLGWQAERLHLHAIVDGAEVMPGALDIRAVGDGQFRWKLKSVGPGAHDLRLVWARPDHRAIPEGASRDVPFTVK